MEMEAVIWLFGGKNSFSGLQLRLGITTFRRQMCLNCQILPLRMGPCSRKQIGVGYDRLHEVCTLNTVEMKMDEYILYTYIL